MGERDVLERAKVREVTGGLSIARRRQSRGGRLAARGLRPSRYRRRGGRRTPAKAHRRHSRPSAGSRRRNGNSATGICRAGGHGGDLCPLCFRSKLPWRDDWCDCRRRFRRNNSSDHHRRRGGRCHWLRSRHPDCPTLGAAVAAITQDTGKYRWPRPLGARPHARTGASGPAYSERPWCRCRPRARDRDRETPRRPAVEFTAS